MSQLAEFYSTIAGLYFFIAGGFLIKKYFDKQIDEKQLLIINIYFFQPLLGFWGFTTQTLSWNIAIIGFLHFLTMLSIAMVFWFALRTFWPHAPYRTLISFTGTNSNTGNIGIPLCAALFGPIGVIAATMINFFNILWNVIFGVYFYARGNFNPSESFRKIFTMPLFYASIVGMACNLSEAKFPTIVQTNLEIGAHASIVMQLFLLGIFFGKLQIKNLHWPINLWVNFIKFILFPAVGIAILYCTNQIIPIPKELQHIAIVMLFLPLAVNNVNIAALYDNHPQKVTQTIFTSSIIFLVLVPIILVYWV